MNINAEALFSPYWYLVSDLKPKLRTQTQIHRHHYRGNLWYLLEDHCSARYHRFTEAAYFVIGRLNGERTIEDIWDSANTQLADDAPTQDEIIQLLGQLHSCDVLICEAPPESEELLRRHDHSLESKLKRKWLSPLLMRFALLDPDKLLKRILPFVQPLFSRWFAVMWICTVGTALGLAITHWAELSSNIIERSLAPQNLILLWVCFPLVKTLHEFGHAVATKYFGGEVHEMGISLLVLTPVPYVDASSASAFSSKKKRIFVGAAGMIVELFVAALAMFLWLGVQPGLVQDFAYTVMFIAGVSTVLFNANPLLKFDGYYMLSDALETPNLAGRSYNYIGYLIKRYCFGIQNATSPLTAEGEKSIFVNYAVASLIYRVIILLVIILFVASKFFFLGVCLALWVIFGQIGLPITKAIRYIASSSQLRGYRIRACAISSSVVLLLLAIAFLLPLPYWTRVEGVVWLPEQSQVRSGVNGTITRIVATPNAFVLRDQPLFISEDPFIQAQIKGA